MKEIVIKNMNMMEKEFSRGFNHCLGKEEQKRGVAKNV